MATMYSTNRPLNAFGKPKAERTLLASFAFQLRHRFEPDGRY